MANDNNPNRSNVHDQRPKQPKRRLLSRTRLVMGLLLVIAVPIFVGLANKAVQENADAIRQMFGG
jgi:hypothetical protein